MATKRKLCFDFQRTLALKKSVNVLIDVNKLWFINCKKVSVIMARKFKSINQAVFSAVSAVLKTFILN